MDLACLRLKSGTRAYLYCTCRYGDVSRLLSPLANGTKIKHLKPEALGYTDMTVPTIELQQQFEDAVNPTSGASTSSWNRVSAFERLATACCPSSCQVRLRCELLSSARDTIDQIPDGFVQRLPHN